MDICFRVCTPSWTQDYCFQYIGHTISQTRDYHHIILTSQPTHWTCVIIGVYWYLFGKFDSISFAFSHSDLTRLGVRKSNRSVKKLSDEVLVWLSVWSEVQIDCMQSSWCHCLPILLLHYSTKFLSHKGHAECQTLKFNSNNMETYNIPFSVDELLDALSKSAVIRDCHGGHIYRIQSCRAMGTAVCWWLGSDSWNWRGAD